MTATTAIEDLAYGRLGQLGQPARMVFGLVEPNVEDNLPTSTHFGWVPEVTHVYASVRDGEGMQNLCYRKLGTSASLGLMVTGERGATGQRSKRQPESRAAFRGEYEQGLDPEGFHVAASPSSAFRSNSPMQPMRVTRGETTVKWEEGDILSLEGTLIGGKGHAVMMPGDDERSGMYCLFMHHATGHVCGREVDAVLAWAQSWFKPGVSWFTHAWWRYLEHNWVDIGARYDDGTLEEGAVLTGPDGFRCAIIQRDGVEVAATHDVTATVIRNDDLYPERVEYLIDGRRATWTRRPAGEIHHPFVPGEPDIYRPGEGAFRFDDDDREQTVTMGWLDTFVDGRDGFARPTPPAQ